MAHTEVSEPAKRRILQTCVRLFLAQGYEKTTMSQILREARVSNSSFQNIFRNKDGVLIELTKFMFANQFGTARRATGQLPPVYVYAAETAIQLALTEQNEHIRDIYVRSYTRPELLELIVRETARELAAIFGPYLPGLTEEDFYYLDIGSSGIMRSFMARPCDEPFPLDKKLEAFLSLSLRAYNVPGQEVAGAVAFVKGLDVPALAQGVLENLIRSLEMYFDITLPDKEESVCTKNG